MVLVPHNKELHGAVRGQSSLAPASNIMSGHVLTHTLQPTSETGGEVGWTASGGDFIERGGWEDPVVNLLAAVRHRHESEENEHTIEQRPRSSETTP